MVPRDAPAWYLGDARLRRFVGFYRAGKPLVVVIHEHLAYPVEHAPRGFVRDA